MRIKTEGLAAAVVAAVLYLGVSASGQGTPVTINLTNVNGDPIVNVGGEEVYAGVYGGTSNLAGANTGIICDDFYDEVGVPQTWSATAYQASSLTSSNLSEVLFGGNNASGYQGIGIAGYAEIAYLVELSFKSSGNPTLQGDISEAIWSISDPAISSTLDAAANALVAQAIANAAATGDSMSQYANLWIYTPSPLIGAGEPQEMWVTVPEGVATLLYLLLAAAVCFGAMRLRSRNFDRSSGIA